MSRFVPAFGNESSGFPMINLDHVARLVPRRKDGKSDGYECMTAAGESLGTIALYENVDPSPVVTADTTGTIAVTFYLNNGVMETARFPVVAWRHEALGIATPVCAVDLSPCSNVRWCLELRTSIWAFPEESEFSSLADATVHARAQLEANARPT